MNGTEKLGCCVYMVCGCCNIGRIDRGGWLEFRCKIDWMAAGDLVEIRVKI